MSDKSAEANDYGGNAVKVTLSDDGTAQIALKADNYQLEAFSNMSTDKEKTPGVLLTHNETPNKLGMGMTSVASYGDQVVEGAKQWLADGKLDQSEANKATILALQVARHVVSSPLAVYSESEITPPAIPKATAPRER